MIRWAENYQFIKGDPLSILSHLIDRYPVKAVYWNRRYEPAHIACDRTIKESLKVPAHSYNGSLLWEPWTIKNGSNEAYKVFTPFYRKGCLNAPPPRQPLPAPEPVGFFADAESNQTIDQLGLLPNIRWDTKLAPHWSMGEEAAHKRLEIFLSQGLGNYKEGRNFPAKPFTSRLSPYLHFGNISPNQAWYAARSIGDNPDIDCFCSELGWREFSYSQLFHHPGLPHENWQKKFDRFPWLQPDNDPRKAALKAWQTGQTGIPLVDAGMRELWQTGYMHNRVRMVTGSFLVKNLLLHWWHGLNGSGTACWMPIWPITAQDGSGSPGPAAMLPLIFVSSIRSLRGKGLTRMETIPAALSRNWQNCLRAICSIPGQPLPIS